MARLPRAKREVLRSSGAVQLLRLEDGLHAGVFAVAYVSKLGAPETQQFFDRAEAERFYERLATFLGRP